MRMVKMASKNGEHFGKTGFQRNFGSTSFGFPEWLHDVHPNFAPNFAGPGFKLDPSPHFFLKHVNLSHSAAAKRQSVQHFVAILPRQCPGEGVATPYSVQGLENNIAHFSQSWTEISCGSGRPFSDNHQPLSATPTF